MDMMPETSCSRASPEFSSRTPASPTFVAAVEEQENVTIAIDRVREEFALQTFTVSGHTFGAPVSFGIAGFHGNVAPNLSDLVSQADAALYLAKHKGRNRIEFAN